MTGDNEERLSKAMTKILPPYADLGATFVDTTTHFNERTYPLSMSITSSPKGRIP